MFRTIVVGCDESEHAADALALAQQLRHPEGRLLLTAVHPHYGPLPDRRGGYHYAEYMSDLAYGTLATAAATLPADVPVERHVLSDDSVGRAIDELARREEADLIVLGSTHHRRFGRMTGRTTVQHLVQGAPCAVAVAAPGQPKALDARSRLCVAYDGSPEAGVAVDVAYDIAAGTGASVMIIRVVEPVVYSPGYVPVSSDVDGERELGTYATASLADLAERAPEGVRVERQVLHGPVPRTILDFVHGDFDLVLAGSRHYGPLHRVLAGSVSTPLLTDGELPVLVTTRAATAADEEAADEGAAAVS